jgi:hypothetical protein
LLSYFVHSKLGYVSAGGISANTAFQARSKKGGSAVQVRLTQKLANKLDGVDVTTSQVGDVLDLPDSEATVLIVEGWAERVVVANAQVPTRPGKPFS